jgi:hypothetical protein
VVIEKPTGNKKGETWRVGLADGRLLPLSLFGGSDALGRISVISEGEPRRLPHLGIQPDELLRSPR